MGIIVEVKSIAGKCKYHKKAGEIYTLEDLAPKGMCLDAYHAAYPYCLALSEGASFRWMKDEDPDAVFCQCSKSIVVIEIKRPLFITAIEKNMTVFMKVSKIRGKCPKKMKVGDEFLFNLGQKEKEICPAGFNAIFPYLLGYAGCRGKDFWENTFCDILSKQDILAISVECPDNINRVEYRIREDWR